MLRSILRNVQYALLISSLMLFIMGVQRMQSFEFHHHGMSLSPWAPPSQVEDDYDSTSEENAVVEPAFRVGSHHQLVLGRQFRVGLFRFWLPRLHRLDDDEDQAKMGTKAKLRPLSWKVPVKSVRKQETAYIVSIDSYHCTKSLMSSAMVLSQSIQNLYKDADSYRLYAYFVSNHNNETATMDRCEHFLQSAGYKLLSDSDTNGDVSACLDDSEQLLLFQAHHIDADLIVPVPLPSLLMGTRNLTRSSDLSSTTESSTSPTLTNMRLLRPQRRSASLKASLLTSGFLDSCHDDNSKLSRNKSNKTLTMELPSWEDKACDASGACDLTMGVSLVTFSNCLLPWTCSGTNYDRHTECLQQPPFCRQRQDEWLRLRDDARMNTHADRPEMGL